MAKKYWLCKKCGSRWERTKQKCASDECAGKETAGKRPKPRVAAHKRTLRDDPYPVYVQLAKDIHGVTDESCCVCGKPRSQERRHDRDHDHTTGLPRGLACGGTRGCNKLMVHWLTLERARLIVAYYERVEAFYVASRRDPAGRDKTSKGAK